MSIGTKLLAGLLQHEKGLETFFKLHLDDALFKGAEQEVFVFFAGHVAKYGALPNKATIEAAGFTLPTEVEEPPQYYYDKVVERDLHLRLKQAVLDSGDMLNKQKPVEALERLTIAVQEAMLRQHKNRIVDFAAEGQTVVHDEYKKKLLLGDHYGLKFGWPSLDAMTGGLSGGDVVSMVGRPAMGKTYQMLYTALHQWKEHGRRPLFVSMEMKPVLIMQRLAAMDAKKSITQLKTAELSTSNLKAMMTQLQSNKTKQPFWVVDGSLSATVDDITMLARQLKPDVVYIDGAYLLRHPNVRMGRWERVTENAERTKSVLAEGLDLPVVQSYQFNREATKKKHGAPGVEDIAYTDAIGQLSSVVLGLMQEESVETLIERKIQVLKGRNGETGEFTINWKFDTAPDWMNFSEKLKPKNEAEAQESIEQLHYC